jgi:amino acid transporter/nucleotide-binding universal stress UspA family protein
MEQEHVLERGLGLTSIIAISMGAMIGSGIFILPGLAMAEAGPAVVLSFIIAGLLVLPAAVSIAELGTAMPEAGGDYIFIERGLGPGAGTIAGLGTWLMLMFKGALALVGGMFYLTAVISLPNVEATAVIIGTILIAVNIVGVKQTGGLQVLMVIIMVFILGLFITFSFTNVEVQYFTPFFDGGTTGLISATVMVLISYGGVTKVAAVAEEIENPGRNLPLGLLLSLIVTTVLYALIVFVLVGIVDGETLSGSNIPMVDAVEPFFGQIGIILIVVAAMLALISTANAGILTASRYPFALSRDKLLPEIFAYVNKKLHTPVLAIVITGGAMLLIIVTLPVEEIAKTAGAFQIVVYILVNIALIAFRTRKPAWYKPEFKSPFYPWIQLFGIISGVGILSQMDTLPLIGGVGIVITGIFWYLVYGRQRVEREGILGAAIAEKMETSYVDTRPYRIIVPIANPANQRQLLRIAAASASGYDDAEIIAVSVIVVPDQTALAQEVTFEKERLERREQLLDEVQEAARDLNIGLKTKVIVGRNVSRVILNLIDKEKADEVIIGWKGKRKRRKFILGSIIDPIVKQAPCRVMLVKQKSEKIGDIVAFVGTGPHSKSAIRRAADLTKYNQGSTLTLVNLRKSEDESDNKELTKKGNELILHVAREAGLNSDLYESKVIISDDLEKSLLETAGRYDTTCIGATRSSPLERALFGSFPELAGEKVDGTVLIVRGEERSFYSTWHIFKRFFQRNL